MKISYLSSLEEVETPKNLAETQNKTTKNYLTQFEEDYESDGETLYTEDESAEESCEDSEDCE